MAGWIDGCLLQAPSDKNCEALQFCDATGSCRSSPLKGLDTCESEGTALVFHGKVDGQWSGLVSVEPGSRLRLAGPSQFRLSYGRARHVLPHAVLVETDGGAETGPNGAQNGFMFLILLAFLLLFVTPF